MNKLQLFLLVDGLVIAGFLALVVRHYMKSKESHFRDDIWKEQRRKREEGQRQAIEDQVDHKILLEHRKDPDEPKEEERSPQQPFKVPNFRGKPHEILGISAEADSDHIQKAFKHWIKRYHPDRVSHLGDRYIEQARRRAEQLNSARQQMLQALSLRKK